MDQSQLVCDAYLAPGGADALLVLAHGAGAGHEHPFMVGTAEGLARRQVNVITFNFPYMQQGKKVPDPAATLEKSFRQVIDAVRGNAQFKENRLFIGGKSMGGRIATQLAAQGIDGLAGVIALGYPLHPPDKPELLRSSHFPNIAVPTLIVQGEKDTFGTPDELRPVIKRIKGPVTLHVVAGGDHSLAIRGKRGDEVMDGWLDVVAAWIMDAR